MKSYSRYDLIQLYKHIGLIVWMTHYQLKTKFIFVLSTQKNPKSSWSWIFVQISVLIFFCFGGKVQDRDLAHFLEDRKTFLIFSKSTFNEPLLRGDISNCTLWFDKQNYAIQKCHQYFSKSAKYVEICCQVQF